MLNSTNLIGLASNDGEVPIYLPSDVYVGMWAGPTTTTINLPSGTRSVVFATAATSKSNINIASITLGGVSATALVQTYQTQEYYKGSGVWAVNYTGSGPTTLSFTCAVGCAVTAFALKRQFSVVGADDTAIDVSCGGSGLPFDAYVDLYKDGLVVCSWRPYNGPTSINSPFTTFWSDGGVPTAFAASLVVPTATQAGALIRAYTQGDGGAGCDDGATMSVASFQASRFI